MRGSSLARGSHQGDIRLLGDGNQRRPRLFVDDIVVIGAGRLLAAAPIETISDAAERAVIVQTDQADRFEMLLQQHGVAAERHQDRLSIVGTGRSTIAQLALDNQIRLDELTDHQASLEDVLVDLTHSSAEFASA